MGERTGGEYDVRPTTESQAGKCSHEPSVGESAAERWEPGARRDVTVDASRRLKRARVESMYACWEIGIVQAEQSRCRGPI